ncbi:arginine N-methyltransferase 2 [Xylariomycetidae sp. FL2044]|nr:arginine N-methyltransferase 2 [Xylariomycetidae sp. FL2044]
MAAAEDSKEVRIPATCPANISEILHCAWRHDLASLKPLLSAPGRASVQEPTTGETPLHAAIRACAGTVTKPGDDNGDDDRKAAAEVVRELFMNGAIWNDPDDRDETPGDVAARLGLDELYGLCVDAGVRAELLLGLLDGYEELESADEEDQEDEEGQKEEMGRDGNDDDEMVHKGDTENKKTEEDQTAEDVVMLVDQDPDRAFAGPAKRGTATGADTDADVVVVRSDEYLRSDLTYDDGKLVDASHNGVMMAWETSIMRASVDALLPPPDEGDASGRRILNIGFGMGIIDGMFRSTRPSKHHIIEAHPAVLAHIANSSSSSGGGDDDKDKDGFGAAWEASGPAEGAYKVHAGRWQEVVPRLLAAGELYDAIYFDTFGEDYAQLRLFFTEHVPGLLDEGGAFGFFNGLGADRQICYDVYTRVVEMHLSDAGMDVDWRELDVDMQGLEEAGRGEWEGVKRRYWTLAKYRLPKCTFMG